jgi:undecaprenyl diphosphate synthase
LAATLVLHGSRSRDARHPGGERRLSDFLLWESAYAELAFLDVNFPDLSTADLDAVFADYAKRERRYGAVPAPANVSAPTIRAISAPR